MAIEPTKVKNSQQHPIADNENEAPTTSADLRMTGAAVKINGLESSGAKVEKRVSFVDDEEVDARPQKTTPETALTQLGPPIIKPEKAKADSSA